MWEEGDEDCWKGESRKTAFNEVEKRGWAPFLKVREKYAQATMKRKFVNENAAGSLFFLHQNSEDFGKMTSYSQHDILIKLKREFFLPFAMWDEKWKSKTWSIN